MVLTGIDVIEKNNFSQIKGSRAGLLVNQASVNRNLVSAVDILFKAKSFELKAIFGPQHGIGGTTQDNMIEWQSFKDKKTGLPIYSLYGEVREPKPEMLEGIDTVIIDLFDVGARYYTFLWTAYLMMQSCSEKNIRVVILDRPNPINGVSIEGSCIKNDYYSFVGLYSLSIRHGMTIGEILTMIKAEMKMNFQLEIVKVEGWERNAWFDELGLPWVIPSPNMPTIETAIVYPGFCLLEGTMLSEGRGTTRPFEFFGAPYIDSHDIIEDLEKERLPGVRFRPAYFEPTFQKHAKVICGGAQMHIMNRNEFRSVITAVAVLKAIKKRYPDDFKWKDPPYEYEYEKMPIDILSGGKRIREFVENDTPVKEIMDEWQIEEDAFRRRRKEFLFY